VGRPALGTEVRLTDEGELLVRSDCMFSGYYQDPQKTAKALVDGWCHTGDAVHINDAGHLIFMDRLEHMGELSSGIKYAPQYIEGRLRFSPYIKDAMVIGGKDKTFVSAILNINFSMVGKWRSATVSLYHLCRPLPEKRDCRPGAQRPVRVNGTCPSPPGSGVLSCCIKSLTPTRPSLPAPAS